MKYSKKDCILSVFIGILISINTYKFAIFEDGWMTFDWKIYLYEQLQWAECLISRAEECEGNDLRYLKSNFLFD